MKTFANPDSVREILERLSALQPDTKGRWGRMSAQQMICHLSDSYRAAMGGKSFDSAVTFQQRYILRWFALYLPVAWPKGVPTRPEADQEAGGTRPSVFSSDAAELRALIQRFGRMNTGFTPHPTMGQLTFWEWMRWGYLHADHHLRQFGL